LRAELFDDIKLSHRVATRTDRAVDFDWGLEPAAENLPRDNFAIRWTGQLNVPRKGQYTLVVNVNSAVRIFLGGKQVLDELDGTHKRSGVKVALTLEEGLQPIRIEYWDTGGEAKIKLQWIMPGETRETPIPASAFCHDPAEGM
ncbi:MAG: hypothetical protein K8T91_16190, partial [Planctomycetes bacterium]|nr:hypothetical protein [Planctomycetota bacterium]